MVSNGLRNKDMHAQVILNLTEKKVEKNSFNAGKNFDEIFEYFFTNYSQYITEVMGQLDPAYLTEVVDRLQASIEEPVDVAHEEVPSK